MEIKLKFYFSPVFLLFFMGIGKIYRENNKYFKKM